MRDSRELQKLVHDLRNRINNIAMNAELAKLEIATFDPINNSTGCSAEGEITACLTNILVACKESAEVMDDIAKFSLPDLSGVAGSNNAIEN